MCVSYACYPNHTKGRFFAELEDKYRSCFQRDRDRIIHSNAFRKLEYKTQVFINYAHDYYRTRLTHTLEVAQIARSIARRLGLNEDITECIALAHDLGHPPFGHTGEYALKQSVQELQLNAQGYGFDHNTQTVRILVHLEHKHIHFDGLNLSWEVIEGISKHNGPLIGQYATSPTENKLMLEYNEMYMLEFETFSSAEAQVAAIADDIAYTVHDLDDALRAGLFAVENLLEIPLIGDILCSIKDKYPDIHQSRIIHTTLSKAIGVMIDDIVSQSEKNIQHYKIKTVEDIRGLDRSLIVFSQEFAKKIIEIKKFNMHKIYKHYKLNRTMNKAKQIIKDLFTCFYEKPELLPTEWSNAAFKANKSERSIVICDYISGMTDRFAIHEHRRIFDTSYEMTSF